MAQHAFLKWSFARSLARSTPWLCCTQSRANSTSPSFSNFLHIMGTTSGNSSAAKMTGAVAIPLFRSFNIGLPNDSALPTKSSTSSTYWKANPTLRPYSNARSQTSFGCPPIVLQGREVFLAAGELHELSGNEVLDNVGEQLDDLGVFECCEADAGPCKQKIAREYGELVSSGFVEGAHSSPGVCFVNDVVVQQACDVYHFGDFGYPLLPSPHLFRRGCRRQSICHEQFPGHPFALAEGRCEQQQCGGSEPLPFCSFPKEVGGRPRERGHVTADSTAYPFGDHAHFFLHFGEGVLV
eukprot:scaffold3659_cov348-Pavlova_lutheri.AAC.2